MASDPLFVPGRRLPAADLNALSPDPIAYTPTWTLVTLGTTGLLNEGWWWSSGREIKWVVELILGTGGDVTGVMGMEYPSSAGAPACDPTMASAFVATFWASEGASNRFSGSGVGTDAGITRIVGDATPSGWTTTVPFNWVAGSTIRGQGSYIAA